MNSWGQWQEDKTNWTELTSIMLQHLPPEADENNQTKMNTECEKFELKTMISHQRTYSRKTVVIFTAIRQSEIWRKKAKRQVRWDKERDLNKEAKRVQFKQRKQAVNHGSNSAETNKGNDNNQTRSQLSSLDSKKTTQGSRRNLEKKETDRSEILI